MAAAPKHDQKSKVEKPKRVRKSKVRTSIPTVAEGEEASKPSPKKASKQQSSNAATNPSNSSNAAPGISASITTIPPSSVSTSSASNLPPQASAAPDFSSWYLRTVTQEFGEDIDRIRQANDFKASSLNVLIHALQQGEACFSDREKRAWDESVAARGLVELSESRA